MGIVLRELINSLTGGDDSKAESAVRDLAELAREVYTVERVPALAETASRTLDELGYKNIKVKTGDGSCGWEEHAPYDGIVVTCGAPSVPEPLKKQLQEGGRLVIPVGESFSQALTVVERKQNKFKQTEFFGCIFVPLIGKYGWRGE